MADQDPAAVWAKAATNAPNTSVHGPLPFAAGSIPTSLQGLALQLGQAFRAITEAALRQVALALGAVEIFGWSPYEALVEIGDDIIDAKTNFNTLLAAFGLPTMDDVAAAMVDASNNAIAAVNDIGGFLVSTGQASLSALGAALASLIAWLTSIPANLISGALNPVAVTLSGTPIGDLLQYINSAGQFNAAQLQGALAGTVTFGGTALSTLLQNLNSSGQFAVAGLVGDITRGMSTDMQAVIDNLANAFTGGTYGIPQTPAPTYGSTGAGKTWVSGNDSWAHTVVGNAIVVHAVYLSSGAAPTFSIGGNNIPLLTTLALDANFKMSVYGLMTPPTGAQTVSCVPGANIWFAANSVSYSGVGSFGTAVTNNATGTALSHTVTALATDLVSQSFSGHVAAVSAYNRTQRYAVAVVGAQNLQLTIGDASIGATSVSFTATASGSVTWGSLAVPLHGITTTSHATAADIIAALASVPASILTGALNGAVTLGGTALSTLSATWNAVVIALTELKNALSGIFNPLQVGDVSLPALVSQIQTGLQGILPAIVQNANGTASVLSSAAITVNSNGTATYNQVANGVQTLVNQANGTMATVAQSFQAQAQAAATQAGNNLTAAAANVQQVFNGLFGGFSLFGAPAPAATPTQAYNAVAAAAQQLLDSQAGLTALQALLDQAQQGGGFSVNINFSDYSDGPLPAGWTDPLPPTGSPTYFPDTASVSSGYVVSANDVVASNVIGVDGAGAIYDTPAGVDNLAVTGIFAGVASGSAAVLVGRSNSAATTYVFAVGTADVLGGWGIYCVVAGSPTYLGSINDIFTNGAAYTLVCGTGATANRVYQIKKNGILLGSVTDSGNFSQHGGSYRQGGFAVLGSAKISSLVIADAIPPSAVGSGFRAYRTGTGNVTISAGTNLLANSFFDTVEAVTADLTSAPATNNRVTVSVAGWYSVTICLYIATAAGGNAGPVLYKNGAVIRRGSISQVATPGANHPYSSTFQVYCAAGDYLQPGVYGANGSSSTTGEATGTYAYWEIAFANRGTLS